MTLVLNAGIEDTIIDLGDVRAMMLDVDPAELACRLASHAVAGVLGIAEQIGSDPVTLWRDITMSGEVNRTFGDPP